MARRLAAILAADAVGFSRLMSDGGEEGTLALLNRHRTHIEGHIASHQGRIFGRAGDSIIAEFASPVEAVRCATGIQTEIESENAGLPEQDRMQFRIGIHLGDVIDDGGNLMGDGVNIAARLEAIAPPSGICISKPVADQVLGRVDAEFAGIGARDLKNIANPVEIWVWPSDAAKTIPRARTRWRVAAMGVIAACLVLVSALAYLRPGSPNDPAPGARVAIIPFQNVGGNAEDDYFSEGLTRDINSLLARFSNLTVMAPQAGAAYRDDLACDRIREELDADYILSGSVRRSEDRLRVTTDFTDATTCRQLASPGPFDRDLSVSDVLDIQTEIAASVASQVGSGDAPLFNADVQRAIREKAPESLDAYECVLLAYWFYQSFTLESHRDARDCLLRMVEAEPGYSQAWSRLAFNHIESKKNGFDTQPDWENAARHAAAKALETDSDNADGHYALAILSRVVGEDREVFRARAERTLELNPNDSWILADLGTWTAYSGDWEQGKALITRARELNPKLHPAYGIVWHFHAFARGDYDEARNILLGLGCCKLPMNYITLAASYALNGEQAKAEETFAALRIAHPEALKVPRAPFEARGMPAAFIDTIIKGLQVAGLDPSGIQPDD